MTSPRLRPRAVHLLCALVVAVLAFARNAKAEKVIAKQDDWEVFTDGRAGGFASYVWGDAFPPPIYEGDQAVTQISGGGWKAEDISGDPSGHTQGKISTLRIRTGFIGNLFGFGVRNKISDTLKASAYIQMWSYIESDGKQKGGKILPVDVRQSYARLESTTWGSVTAGRQRGLFSRGATDIDTMYADRWALGFPSGGQMQIDTDGTGGPTSGHVGFGVLGSGFAAGVVYATPVLAGFQLTAGLYDPTLFQGSGAWTRTGFARPEGELTFERPLGTFGKVVVFTNGGYQKLYHTGHCVQEPCTETAEGFGYGGRLELGFFHLGVAGHYGRGLGLSYELEVTDAAADVTGKLRTTDGYYVQSQFVLGPVDLQAGWGISRLFLTATDKKTSADPTDTTGMRQIYPFSFIKDQMGISWGAVYHYQPFLHFDLDFFRAQADWYLGEKQVMYAANAGMTYSW